uniref:3-deoxy-7-phosphoheptulonate synthase n=1 Tax=Sphingomonas parva TaxID=2555898 RepID=UPI001CDB5210
MTGPDGGAPEWTPASWRSHPAQQMPVYPDASALASVEEQLAATPPLVGFAQIGALRSALAEVARGRAFLLQGGDCAESFAEFSAEKVRRDERLLLGMGNIIADGGLGVVHVARAAGQFAKPRSQRWESEAGLTLPSYRGDAVNGRAFTSFSRTPEPERLLEAHRQSQATLALLAAFRLAERSQPPVYASHEALLLHYEQALTRRDPETGRHWAGSGHMVWVGERTRSLDGAHVAYASGIANPIGLKCGPSLAPETLLRLIERLDPANEPGRLVLIGRFGADRVGESLAPLMRAARRAGSNAIWAIDPMHGNGTNVAGVKTRRLSDILVETAAFFDIAAAEGVHAGGIHLEMSGSDVTECLGGRCGIGEADLSRRYLSHCDPRLNPAQALEIATKVAALIGKSAERRADAA